MEKTGDVGRRASFNVRPRSETRLQSVLSVIALLALMLVFGPDGNAQVTPCGNDLVNNYHLAQCNAAGKLIPWNIDDAGPFDYIMSLQARWWLNAPNVNGWPTYLTAAEIERNYSASDGAIPATTATLGIEAYLKYYAYTGNTAYLNMVVTMADYLVQQALTPSTYSAYPRFPWPVGATGDINPNGSGHPNNDDMAGVIMPDKGAMVGVALLHVYEATGNIVYLEEAIQIANVLANNAVIGDDTQSPWPFRAQGDSGAFVVGPVMGNQVFALRLYDELLRLGYDGNGQYQATRDNVWNWLKNVAIADTTGDHWAHFFEDHTGLEYDPTQWDALEMARYLLEKRDALDPDWFAMAGSLIDLVKNRWIVHSGDYTAIAEQEQDPYPYNSHTARYASILSKYYEAGGPPDYKDEAYSSFAYSTYSVDFDGFPDTYFNGGIAWSSDSLGDWMLHFMDGIAAVPEWAPGNANHLLRSTSIVKSVAYDVDSVSYTTFDPSGREKLKLRFTPVLVRVDGSAISTWTWDATSQVLIIDRTGGTTVDVLSSTDFSLSVSPASQTIAQGSSTSYTVTVTALNGFNGDVGLDVNGLPDGATASLSPTSVTGSGSSVLNVTTSSDTPTGSYSLTIVGSANGSNVSTRSTLNVTSGSSGGLSIFSPDTVPYNLVDNARGIEVGVRFRSDVDGTISGIRFYKNPTDTTIHTGSLWSSSGQLLAGGTFSNETATGWQQLNFSFAVPIQANTTYVASYHTSSSYFEGVSYFADKGEDNPPLHALQDGVDGTNGVYVYSPGGVFPDAPYFSANYWADVVFSPSGSSTTLPSISVASGNSQSATAGTSFAAPLKARVVDGFSNPIAGLTVTFTAPGTGASATFNGSSSAQAVTDSLGMATSPVPAANDTVGTYSVLASVPGARTPAIFTLANTPFSSGNSTITAISGTPQSATAGTSFAAPLKARVLDGSSNPIAGLTVTFAAPASGPGATFNGSSSAQTITDSLGVAISPVPAANTAVGTYSVVVSASGVATSATFTLTNTTVSSGGTKTIFTPNDVPANYVDNSGGVEMGLKFRSDVSGTIIGIRFYKNPSDTNVHTGSLWSSTTRQLLATGNFTNETAGGWQQMTFAAPVAIQANTTYVASYHTDGSFYSDLNFFVDQGVDNPPLHALREGVDGPNSVYQYGGGGLFPDLTYNSANYWLDVAFTSGGPPPPQPSISVVSGTPQSATTGTSFGAPLKAQVVDASSSDPIAGVTVTFTAPATGASATFNSSNTTQAITDALGIATSPVPVANSMASTYSVIASAAGAPTSAAFTLTNTPVASNTITVVSGTPQSVTVGTSFAVLKAKVLDGSSNPIAGVTVTFTAPASGASATFNGSNSTQAITDSLGVATSTAPLANSSAGTYDVVASATGVPNTATFTLTNTAIASNTITVVSGTPQSVTVNTSFAVLKAKVLDGSSNPIAGVTVTFTAPASGASATFNGSNSTQAITDSLGVATSTAPLANSSAGTYDVVASATGVPNTATFTLTNTAIASNTITVVSGTPQNVTVGTSFAVLKAKVLDGSSNPIAGVTVTFTAPASGASATFNGSNSAQAITDSLGVATSPTPVANSTSGTYNVVASATGVPTTATFTLTNTAVVSNTIIVVSGTPQSVTVGTSFVVLKAKVLDGSSSPIAGVTVTFTAPASGASATFNGSNSAQAITDSLGVATSPTPVANSTSGTYNVVASATGVPTTATFTLTNTAASGGTTTIFASTAVPGGSSGNVGAVEPGVKFRSDVAGMVIGIRFYKGPNDTGVHTGSLWSSTTRQLLATGTFTNETGSGWQQLTFAAPVSIQANTTYIASYHTNASFLYDLNFYANQGVDNPPLHALKAGVDGPNGVFQYGSGGVFPDLTYNSSNYWVDVVFSSGGTPPPPQPSISVMSGTPQSTTVSTSFGAPLKAKVIDASTSNPIAGVTVTFAASTTGASATFGGSTTTQAVTDSLGVATSVVPAANATAGTYGVLASASGAPTSATFTLTNSPVSGSNTITVVSGTPQSVTVGTSFAVLKAKVLDGSSNPIAGVTVTFTAPASGASATFGGSNSAQAITDSLGVATSPAPVANNTAGTYSVVASATSVPTTATFTLTNTSASSGTVTIFPSTAVPTHPVGNSGGVEMGVKFRSDVAGTVIGIRFYKGADTTAHTGSLWSSTGQLLATGSFTNETAGGWQQLNFTTPIAIQANTTYIASYHSSGSFFSDLNYFATQGADNPPLHALRAGVDGPNSVYQYGSGGVFPNLTYQSANYWVDVVFSPN